MNNALQVAGAVVGAVYVLFVPGFVLSFVFFGRGKVDLIERLALSFALSIAVVPLLAFYLNLVGVKISRVNVVLEVAVITVVSGALAWWLARRRKVRGEEAPKPKTQSTEPPKAKPEEPPKPPKPPSRKIQF